MFVLVEGATLDTTVAAMAQLAEQRAYLISRLRSHCGRLDPEDVLSEAILRLAERSRAGTPLPNDVGAYVLRSAKNIVIDFYRSPMSREYVTDPRDLELSELFIHEDDNQRRQIELADDVTLLHQAVANLPEGQQRILIETAVRGRRPKELAREFCVTAAVIATRSRRARVALGNEVCRLLLMRGGPECKRHAARISTRPASLPKLAAHHLRTCPCCARHLRQFESLRFFE